MKSLKGESMVSVTKHGGGKEGAVSPSEWRRWNRLVMALLAVAAAVLPMINLVVDPFDIFMTSPLGTGPYTSQRYHATMALEGYSERGKAVDVVLLGDSVAGINDPRPLLQLVEGGTLAYNASSFMASAEDVRDMLSFMTGLSARPKLVVVALDSYMFTGQPAPRHYVYRMPAEVRGGDRFSWWSGALFAPTVFEAIDKVTEVATGERSVVYDLEVGSYARPVLDLQMASDPMGYARSVFKTGKQGDGKKIPVSRRQLEAISTAVRDSSSKGMHVVWVLQPPSYGLNMLFGEEEVSRNIEAIRNAVSSSGSGLVDLSGMKEISEDMAAYYDLKHYTPEAGRRILERVVESVVKRRGDEAPGGKGAPRERGACDMYGTCDTGT